MRATAVAQPNIALIKYWGKRDRRRNLPSTGSISITLDDLCTEMTVELDSTLANDELLVNGRRTPSMLSRVEHCLDDVLGADRPRAHVTSSSNFPIAAGLASSASSFAALVVAAAAVGGRQRTQAELASLAGRASGSAARSLYGGFVELCNADDDVAVRTLLPGSDWPLRIIAAVSTTEPKDIGSGEAMLTSARTSPFYGRWVEEQPMDLATARDAITVRDFQKLASIAEHNCLKMHSLMWTSRPPIVYWNTATLACLETVRELRADGVAVFFTIDAGPQVKAICLPEEERQVIDALSAVAGVTDILDSGIGAGARLVEQG